MPHLCPESQSISLDPCFQVTGEGPDQAQYAAVFTVGPDCGQVLLVLESPLPELTVHLNGDLISTISPGSTIVYVPLPSKITPYPCPNTLTFTIPARRCLSIPRPCLHARLVQKSGAYILPPALRVETLLAGDSAWILQIHGQIDSLRAASFPATIRADLSIGGVTRISREMSLTIAPGRQTPFQQQLTAFEPHLWSPENPSVYILTLSLFAGEDRIDTLSCAVGFRELISEDGGALLLNGQAFAPRGFRIPNPAQLHPALIEYQLQLIKNIGANIVTADTLLSEPLRDRCLCLGLLYEPALPCSLPTLEFSLFPDSAFLASYEAKWSSDPVLVLATHWNLPVDSGSAVTVPIYSNCQEVELRLNDRMLGRYRPSEGICLARIPYEMGRLEAIGHRDGWGEIRAQTVTTGLAHSLQAYPSKSCLAYGAPDAVVIAVRAADYAGNPVPDADNLIFFEGRSGVQVCQTGAPDAETPICTAYHRLCRGECFAILETTDGDDAVINIYAEGLTGDTVTLPVRA